MIAKKIQIVEVGPRDGLQNEDLVLPTEDKVAFIERLSEAGCKNIEVTRNTKITRHKKRLLTDQEYSQRIENRINDLITKLENNEIKMDILTKEDQKVIIDILGNSSICIIK